MGFNPVPALSSFIADTPTYARMDYDPVNDSYMMPNSNANLFFIRIA